MRSVTAQPVLLLILIIAIASFGCLSDPDRAFPEHSSSSDAGDTIDIGESGESPTTDGETGTSSRDTGHHEHSDEDTSSPLEDDVDVGEHHSQDTGSDSQDTGSPSQDTGSEPEDTGSGTEPTEPEDTGSGSEPAEPTEPADPNDCGKDYWDNHHDGSDPWDPFEIDCDELAASWDCQITDEEELILELINQYRQEEQECGSSTYGPSEPMEMNAQLQCAARIHSWDMSGRNYYAHDTPEGLSPSNRVSIVPGPLNSSAENIYDFWGTPEGAVQGWMNSPGHCKNMMCGSYSSIGVGKYGTMHTLKITGSGICW